MNDVIVDGFTRIKDGFKYHTTQTYALESGNLRFVKHREIRKGMRLVSIHRYGTDETGRENWGPVARILSDRIVFESGLQMIEGYPTDEMLDEIEW